MKKRSIFSLFIIVMAICVFGTFAIVANAQEETPEMNIAYCNVSFRDTVCIKYAVKSNVSNVKILIWDSPKAEYTIGTHDSEITEYYTEDIDAVSHMIFDYTELSAKQMTDVVYARAYANVDGVDYYSQVNKYSILQYAYNKLGKTATASTNTELKEMLTNMLSYGASAQKYFDYNEDRLATADWHQVKLSAGIMDDGSMHGLYIAGDKVTLIASETDANQDEFSHWEDSNGNKVATSMAYELTVGNTNEVYTPVYEPRPALAFKLSDDGTYYIVTGIGTWTSEMVGIPATYKGLPVKAVGSSAFWADQNIRTVWIPDSVTSIGGSSFWGAGNLSSVTIGSGVSYIGGWAFGGSPLLESINFNGTVAQWNNIEKSSDWLYESNIKRIVCSDGTVCIEHTIVVDAAVEPSCNVTGLTEGKHCSACGEVIVARNTVNALGHQKQVITYTEATMTLYSTTNSSSYPFSISGNQITSTNKANSSSSTYTITAKQAFTLELQYKVSSETNYDKLIIKHNSTTKVTVSGTSTSTFTALTINMSAGDTVTITYSKDVSQSSGSDCAWVKIITPATETIKTETTEIVVITEINRDSFASCAEDVFCDVCGEVAIEKIAHTEVVDVAVTPTCTESGLTEGKHCSKCSGVLVAQDVVAALGHDEITHDAQKPTCTEIGWDAYVTCSRCAYTTYTEKASLGHVEVVDAAVAPNCTSTGLTEGSHCSICNEVIVAQEVVPEKHNYKSILIAEPTATEDGVTSLTCLTCGNTDVGVFTPIEFTVTKSNRSQVGYTGRTSENLVIPGVFQKDGEWYRVTKIGSDAFTGCTNLASITLPESIKNVGYSAFRDCTNLKAVYIRDLVAWCGISFSYDDDWDEGYWQDSYANPLRYAHKLYLNGQLITDLVIPDSVAHLSTYAFHGAYFETVTLPEGIKSIPDGAFRDCSMQSIYIPDSVTYIGRYAFLSCSNLQALVMNNVASIGDYAFGGSCNVQIIYCTEMPTISFDSEDGNWGENDSFVTGYICVTVDGAIYGIKDGKATLLFVPDYVSEVDILPSIEYDGVTYTVTSIGEKAFYECSNLLSVKIPNSVTNIGNYAFCGCTNLTDIIIPDSVININSGAFTGCAGLTNIVIGNGVSTIGSYAFSNCTGLMSITIPESVTTISSAAFQSCYKLIEVINQSALPITAGSSDHGDVAYYAAEVHSGPTKIDNQDGYLFYVDGEKNYLLGYSGEEVQLILPSNYKGQSYEICEYAFAYNDAIVSVVIPNGVTSINAYTFQNCKNLIVVQISDSVVSIGESAFYGCTNLKDITIGSNVTSIGDRTFLSCRSLTNIVIPNSVTRIGNYAFEYCTSLESIIVPDSVTYLGYYAFSDCTAMTSAVIGNNVPELSSYVFGDCSNLGSVTIGTGIKTINSYAFSGCGKLNAVYISDIAAWCNMGGVINAKILYLNGTLVTNIVNLVIPEGVTKIEYKTFMGWTALTSVTIPNSVKTIGNDAFNGCTSLKNVVIPNSVEYICWRAFQNCTSLESVTLGNSLYRIYGNAFQGCTSLESVTLGNSLKYIDENAFQGCSALTSIVIPASVETIAPNAFSNCTSLTSVTFETTNRWLISSSPNSGGTILSSTNSSDPTKAAEYLTSTYVGKYWHAYTR